MIKIISEKQGRVFKWSALVLFVLYLITITIAAISSIDIPDNKALVMSILVSPLLIIASLARISRKRSIKSGIVVLFMLIALCGMIFLLLMMGIPKDIIKLAAFVGLLVYFAFEIRKDKY